MNEEFEFPDLPDMPDKAKNEDLRASADFWFTVAMCMFAVVVGAAVLVLMLVFNPGREPLAVKYCGDIPCPEPENAVPLTINQILLFIDQSGLLPLMFAVFACAFPIAAVRVLLGGSSNV